MSGNAFLCVFRQALGSSYLPPGETAGQCEQLQPDSLYSSRGLYADELPSSARPRPVGGTTGTSGNSYTCMHLQTAKHLFSSYWFRCYTEQTNYVSLSRLQLLQLRLTLSSQKHTALLQVSLEGRWMYLLFSHREFVFDTVSLSSLLDVRHSTVP